MLHGISRSTSFVALLLALSPLVTATADEDTTAAQVAALVDQLDARTLRQRVEAERQLLTIGPSALPHLPNPETLQAGTAEAVRRIRVLLERRQALSALQPGRVTLEGRMPLAQILEAITQQTGNLIATAALPAALRERPLDVDFEETVFWEAVLSLEAQARISIAADDMTDALQAAPQIAARPMPLARQVVGPFRIDVVGARVKPDFINPGRRILRFTLELSAEPRLRPLFVHVADADLTVTAGANTSGVALPQTYPPLSPDASRELTVGNAGPLRITHDVLFPAKSSAAFPQLVDVGGEVEVEIAAGRERFEFSDLIEPGPVTRRHGGVSVTRTSVAQSHESVTIALILAYDIGDAAFESYRSWIFQEGLRLHRDGEEPQAPQQLETLPRPDGSVALTAHFAALRPLAAADHLSYEAPTLITKVPVQFSLQGIDVAQ